MMTLEQFEDAAEKVKEVIGRVVGEHPMTMPTPAPLIRVFAYRDSAVEYLVRCWCATEDYWGERTSPPTTVSR